MGGKGMKKIGTIRKQYAKAKAEAKGFYGAMIKRPRGELRKVLLSEEERFKKLMLDLILGENLDPKGAPYVFKLECSERREDGLSAPNNEYAKKACEDPKWFARLSRSLKSCFDKFGILAEAKESKEKNRCMNCAEFSLALSFTLKQ